MRPQILLLATLITSAIGSPTPLPATSNLQASGSWSLENFIRTCNDATNTCAYSFSVNEHITGAQPIECSYTISGSATTSARITDYQRQGCHGQTFLINQGWNVEGNFMVIVVTDTFEQEYAFFGYSGVELVDGKVVKPDHVEKAYFTSKKIKRTDTAERWTVEGLVRSCDSTQCTYTFNINLNDKKPVHPCKVTNIAPSPATQSWYAVRCEKDANYAISWGYNSQYGFAVMTVVSQSEQKDAFFGFDHVNSGNNGYGGPHGFADVGPNLAYPL